MCRIPHKLPFEPSSVFNFNSSFVNIETHKIIIQLTSPPMRFRFTECDAICLPQRWDSLDNRLTLTFNWKHFHASKVWFLSASGRKSDCLSSATFSDVFTRERCANNRVIKLKSTKNCRATDISSSYVNNKRSAE